MLKVASLVAILGSSLVAGCGSDAAGAQQGAAGTTGSGTAGANGGSAGSGITGGSGSTGGSGVTGGVDGSVDDGGPFSLPDLDTACGGGPTGKQLLALIHLPYTGTYTPPAKRAANFAWTGPTVPSALTVGAEYKGGSILCTVDHYVCPGGGVPCRTQNPPMISVDLDVTFKTADGVLNEAFTASVHYGGSIASGFQADLPASKIMGTYPIVTGTKDQVKLVFSAQFEGPRYNGGISEVGQGTSIPAGSWMETAAGGGVDASF